MQRMILFIISILLCSSVATAQDEASVETAGRMNRMVAALRVARVESANDSSELEIVPDQAEQIETLTVDYRAMLQEYAKFIDNDNQAAALTLMASKLPAFEKRLQSDILLPHQTELLSKLVFEDLVRSAGGNLLRSISKNYGGDFKLTDIQYKKLAEIDARIKKETAEAERKFKEELQRIAKNAKEDAEKTLSPKQLETLKSFSIKSSR